MREKVHALAQFGGTRRDLWRKALVLSAVLLCLLLLCPTPAYAFNIFDIEGSIKEWLGDIVNNFMADYVENVNAISTDNLLSGDFSNLFGDGTGAESVWGVITAVHQSVLIPLGESILVFVMLVQVVKISQKIDAQATLPTVKEILFLAAFYVIFHWLINNSLDLCSAVFTEAGKITTALSGGNADVQGALTLIENPRDYSIGQLITLMITTAFVQLIGVFACVVAFVMAAARALQLYAMATFSPIPFALLGFEETRSMGINFCKNFIAVCLAGAIMVFLLTIFPGLMTSVFSQGLGDPTSVLAAANLAKIIGLPLLLMLGLIKSGSWARDIMGG